MQSFWEKLPTPFTILAPMEGVTDVVFRQIITQIGKPNVLMTEFTSCDGIMSKGREKVGESLKFSKNEKPIVAQIWGKNPVTFFQTAKYCKELGFSGIDINMGCPVSAVVRRGECSGLINNPTRAKEIIQATKEGGEGLPVSVKTRLGIHDEKIEEWIGFLLGQDLAALTVHLRTVDEMSKVPAHWKLLPQIIKIRDTVAPKTLIIGNGDIATRDEMKEKYKEYGCEGFMVGRGIFSNPWIFNESVDIEKITVSDRIDLYKRHIQLFDKTWEGKKNPESLKKFCKTYIQNFSDAATLRDKILRSHSTREMTEILLDYQSSSQRVKY